MKIVIADDHVVVRPGFSMILNYQNDMELASTAADGVAAYHKVMKYKHDVLLMDLRMPLGESG
ncbi:LuxR family transcriptional regulator, partial [Staphylococcus aureus]|uniref:response regulator n=1 Tax=Staphylococcus aureus TaxID=1280 RepID=UPI00065B9845